MSGKKLFGSNDTARSTVWTRAVAELKVALGEEMKIFEELMSKVWESEEADSLNRIPFLEEAVEESRTKLCREIEKLRRKSGRCNHHGSCQDRNMGRQDGLNEVLELL